MLEPTASTRAATTRIRSHGFSTKFASRAKRGFSDALGVNLMRDSRFGLPESDSKLLNQLQPRNFIFPWAVPQQYGPANAWLTWEQKSKQNLQQYSKALAPSGIPDDKTNNQFGEGVYPPKIPNL